MAIGVNDVVAVTFRGTCFAQRIMFTRTYRCTEIGAPIRTTVEELNAIINSQSALVAAGGNDIIDAYLACMSTNYTLNVIRAQVISPVRSAYFDQATAQVGNGAGPSTTANIAGVITARGALAGRQFVSNSHIGPIPTEASAAGLLTNPFKLQMESLAFCMQLAFRTGIAPAGNEYEPVIFHYRKPPRPPLAPDRIEDTTVQTTTRVMRRRTVGVGE